ncbi:unnamed protein product [Rhizophagus irregularis]|nr:unnamed protein product [Rhizophagus irregularis]
MSSQTGQTGWVKSGKTDYPTQPNPFGTLDGDNCQRLCSSVGKYNENCKNYNLRNNLKNGNDMHHCSVRVISKSLNRKADHRTAKRIKAKLLISLNGALEEVINNALASQRIICNNNKLRQFAARDDKKLKDDTGLWTQLDSLVNNILHMG